MSTIQKYEYDQFYKAHEMQRYLDFMVSLSDEISFDSDTWICDKRRQNPAQLLSKVTIYFAKIPMWYKEMAKYYAIIRLLEGKSVSTVRGDIGNVAVFLGFMGDIPLSEISVLTASRYKEYLDAKGYGECTRNGLWADVRQFLNRMNGYDGVCLRNPFYDNPYEPKHLIDQKYIPEYVVNQLDRVFMKENIPLTIRCIYWLLRLIPSRISEVLGMKIDCIKPFDGHYCVFIPMWKQNGGYKEPIMRTIHLEDEGIGGHLIALIHEQQKMALSYQDYLPEDKQGVLLAYRRQILQNGVWYAQDSYNVASWPYVSYQFKEICKRNGIQDETGEDYVVTSHQFRHNGITDRLRAGFTLPQIAEMTAHHGTAMIYSSYAHLNLFPETIVEPMQYRTEAENPYVLFAGRILNMDTINESRLLKNLRAHRVPGGICADVTHCKSGLWNCVDCEHFVPELEQLPYFKEQAITWTEKAQRFASNILLHKNFVDIAQKFEIIVEKLEKGCYNGR